MAEAVGIAFTAFQVIGMAAGTAQLTKALWTLSQDKRIGDDISASLNRIQTTQKTIKGAIRYLEKLLLKHPDSDAVQYMVAENTFPSVGRDVDHLTWKMKEMASEIKSMKVAPKFRWILYQKKKLDALVPVMNHIQLILQLASSTIIAELLEARRDPGDKLMEMFKERCDVELKQLAAELRHSVKHELRTALGKMFNSAEPLETERLIRPMHRLAQSLLETGHVPRHEDSQSSRGTQSRQTSMTTSRPSSPITPSSSPPSPLSPVSLPPEMTSRSASPLRIPVLEDTRHGSSITLSTAGDMEVVEMNAIELSSFQEQEARPARPGQSKSSASEAPALTQNIIPGILSLAERTYRPAYSGFLSPDDDRSKQVAITARRDPELKTNLISLARARELRLHIDYDGESKKTVIFEHRGDTEIVGIAKAYWWIARREPLKSVEVSFGVCHRLDEGIIIGRSVLEADSDTRKDLYRH